jgi:radical SAM family protein
MLWVRTAVRLPIKMMPQVIENLEIHAAHACNLACESCSHFSNHGHSGILSLSDATAWMRLWKDRLRPDRFSILGGEPTLNKNLTKLVLETRRHWPHSMIRIVTNGFYLARHPELPQAIADDGNTLLCLSIHHNSKDYFDSIVPHVDLLGSWVDRYDIAVMVYHSYSKWTRRYNGFGSSMEPFEDGDIRKSWEQCPAKLCRQLFEGKIWKCSPLAYLRLQAAKYDLSSKWPPYLAYSPLRPDCSDEELEAFFKREEEGVCGMCPAEPEKITPAYPARRQLRVLESDEAEPEFEHEVLDDLRRIHATVGRFRRRA